ncbi:unnamed protein product [Cylindrotheca closterium]|uniref:Uncharacterized protein n=1 Tax=Cylindrotheca closterium TaxID=2856 RepID=A0AAD2FWP6_9STRA|nr:unnamed protein product [Cylindrotheca closterium]
MMRTTSSLLGLLSILILSFSTTTTATLSHSDSSSGLVSSPKATIAVSQSLVVPSTVLEIPRGGNKRVVPRRKRSSVKSFLGWRERVQEIGDSLTEFTERKTFFSTQLMPKSEADAEWAAFLKGWLLVALPIPLPLMFVALIAYSTLMSFSLWEDPIKRKFIIGLYHGVLVFAVVLREMEEKIEEITHPRQVMILLNVATNLFLGKTGRFKATKFLMDSSTFSTLFYILYQYFDTSSTGTSVGGWYR